MGRRIFLSDGATLWWIQKTRNLELMIPEKLCMARSFVRRAQKNCPVLQFGCTDVWDRDLKIVEQTEGQHRQDTHPAAPGSSAVSETGSVVSSGGFYILVPMSFAVEDSPVRCTSVPHPHYVSHRLGSHGIGRHSRRLNKLRCWQIDGWKCPCASQ